MYIINRTYKYQNLLQTMIVNRKPQDTCWYYWKIEVNKLFVLNLFTRYNICYFISFLNIELTDSIPFRIVICIYLYWSHNSSANFTSVLRFQYANTPINNHLKNYTLITNLSTSKSFTSFSSFSSSVISFRTLINTDSKKSSVISNWKGKYIYKNYSGK